jgi:hypothetical protein
MRLFPSTKGWFWIKENPQRRRLGAQSWVEIGTSETLMGLGQRGLKQPQTPQAIHSAAALNQLTVQLQHLSQMQPPHQARRR